MHAIKTIDFAHLAEWDSQAPDLHQSQLDRVDPRESASTAGRSKMENVVYLLDPETALFRAVELVGAISVKPISDLLGCKLTQMVRFDESHWLFVDAEGLREGLTAFTMFGRYPQPLGGRIVLAGTDGSESYHSPSIDIGDAAAHFQCCRPVIDPVFVTDDNVPSKGLIPAGALEDLKVRIERRRPMPVHGSA